MIELEAKDALIRIHEELLRSVSNNLPVAIWAKDLDNRFVFANKNCCEAVLACEECEVLAMTDADFENDALSQVCGASDDLVKAQRVTSRFVEHGRYHDRDVWLDTTKSPWIEDGELVGTVGFGTIITQKIRPAILNKYPEADSIQIPVDADIIDIIRKRFP